MIKKLFLWLCITAFMMKANESLGVEMGESAPKYLYKVVSLENWEESRAKNSLILSEDDRAFIHLSREDQLQRIIDKFWAKAPGFVVLKLEAKELPGDLIFEANPGGENKYYHLYNGSIPLSSVVESKITHSVTK